MEKSRNSIIRTHRSKLVFIFRLLDAGVIFASLCVSLLSYGISIQNPHYTSLGLLAVIAFTALAEWQHIYDSLRTASIKILFYNVAATWLMVIFVCLLLAYFTKTSTFYSRTVLGIWLVLTPAMLFGLRLGVMGGLAHLRKKGYNTRRVAIVGAEVLGSRLARVIQQRPEFGYRFVGFFEDRRQRTDKKLASQVVGNFNDLVQCAKRGEIDLVYIAISSKGQGRIAELINKLRDTTTSVHLVPDFFVYDLLHSRWANIGSVPTLSIFESPFTSAYGWAKRVEDIVLSLIILLIIALPMLAIAIGVKLSSPGPIIFKQRRYGLDGKAIRVWKFRSMTTCDDGKTVKQATRNDPRVTAFGAFLRRTSLDELPQFINVLKGEMSIVGPRPHAVAHNEEYRKIISGYMLRHKVPPGITGWAQVNGWRGETDTLDKMEKRVECDLWYIRSWSLWLDIKIIYKTVFQGFKSQNAF